MKQQQFEREHDQTWQRFRELLTALEARRRPGPDVPVQRLPRLLRRISGHYALARSRGYSPGLIDELHRLVRRGYRQLYRVRPAWPRQALDFALGGFPRALRRHLGLFWLSCALFFGPMLAMGLACAQDGSLDLQPVAIRSGGRVRIHVRPHQRPAWARRGASGRQRFHDVRLLHPQQRRHRTAYLCLGARVRRRQPVRACDQWALHRRRGRAPDPARLRHAVLVLSSAATAAWNSPPSPSPAPPDCCWRRRCWHRADAPAARHCGSMQPRPFSWWAGPC
jgi:hypothetical protein